jgi:hypothetical protein
MDGFMAITATMIIETEGVEPRDFGTAFGITLTISQVGGVIAPPIGNSFASLHPGLPFIFWAVLSAATFFTLAPIKERLA